MKTLWNEADRKELRDRVRRLAPSATPRWGRMNAFQMMVHITDQLRMSLGELNVGQLRSIARYAPLKQLLIYWLPWPKGAPTMPELIARAPGEWTGEVDAFLAALERFGARDPRQPWGEHPLFGPLSSRAWGALGYHHVDHHFRQFGI
jgi:hypothetical protein